MKSESDLPSIEIQASRLTYLGVSVPLEPHEICTGTMIIKRLQCKAKAQKIGASSCRDTECKEIQVHNSFAQQHQRLFKGVEK